MNKFKESLRVSDYDIRIEEVKKEIRVDKSLSNDQKREQLRGLDRLKQIEEVMRKRNEEAWEK